MRVHHRAALLLPSQGKLEETQARTSVHGLHPLCTSDETAINVHAVTSTRYPPRAWLLDRRHIGVAYVLVLCNKPVCPVEPVPFLRELTCR